MILLQMVQQPLYNSINLSLSVADPANDTTCSRTSVNSYLCPSDSGAPSVVPVLADPPDPQNPAYTGSTTVDTVARGNYVGMFGLGEICAASNPTGAPLVGPVSPGVYPPGYGIAAGIFYRNSRTSIAAITDGTSQPIAVGERRHNLSYVTWTARSIGGWLGKMSLIEGGTDQFNPSPEECWTQVLGPAGLEDGTRTPNDRMAHVEDYWSRHPGGVNFLFADGSVHFYQG
jgi:prepilin-type processing-associated H-X9-DG protein